jgi:hypothetical protein
MTFETVERCAHLSVSYDTVTSSAGDTRGWWQCTSCQMRFWPVTELPAGMHYEPLPEPNRIDVVEFGPDDILVLRVPVAISQEQNDEITGYLEKRFPGRRFLVLGDGITLDVLREVKPADAKDHGGSVSGSGGR